MTVTLPNGDRLKFWFSYDTGKHNRHVQEHTRVHCDMGTETNPRPFQPADGYDATVTRHHRDVPNRPAARRAALTKFLEQGALRLAEATNGPRKYEWVCDRSFTREERRAIWQEYFRCHADLGKVCQPKPAADAV